MTSDNMMDLTSFPRSMVILGTGIVGCEFATIFANFGQTKVYLIDRADRILPFEDEDVRILGMRVLGAHASTTIEAVSLMMKQDRSVCDLAELLHPHPAVTEGGQECARMLLGTSIYKPQVFQSDLRLSRVTYSD